MDGIYDIDTNDHLRAIMFYYISKLLGAFENL